MKTGMVLILAHLAIAGTLGCGGGDGATEPVTPVVTTVEISPSVVTMFMGDTIQLTATVKDQNGGAVAGKTVTWASDATTVASIDSLGVVVAKTSGTARISASVDGKTGSVSLTSTGPGTTGAVAGSATVGTTGGSVQATLPGGGTLGLTIPSGALRTPVTITLEPAVPPPGALASFRFTPAGVRFNKDATLVIKLSSGAKLRPNSALVIAQGGQNVPVPGVRNLVDGTLTVSLSALGLPADSTAVAARMRVSMANAIDSSFIGTVENMTPDVLFNSLQRALDSLVTTGTVANAERVQMVMESLTDIHPTSINDSRFTPLRMQWQSKVCGEAEFAFNALSSFNVISDYRGFERVMANVIKWHRVAQEMDTFVRAAVGVETVCFGALPNAQTRVHDKLVALRPGIDTDLNAFVVDPPPRDVSFFVDRLRPLIDLAGTFEQANFDADVQIITEILATQTVRLRPIGYARCRSQGPQAIQGHLARGINDGALTGVTLEEIHADIELCGMAILWDVLDTDGVSASHGVLGGGDLLEEPPTPTGSATMVGAAQLKLSRGLIQALLCPAPASSNNEQLEISAGPNASSLTRVAVISPSNSNQYLASSDLFISAAQLRTAGGIPAADSGVVTVVIRRIGGLCSNMFALPEHTTIGTLLLTMMPDATVYFRNFNSGAIGTEWSVARATTSPSGQRYLGELGNESTTLTIDTLPAHTKLTLDVDLYIIDSWNGNGGQGSASAADIIEISVVGGPVLKRTTFSNKPSDVQAFPGDFPGGVNPAGTGAIGKSTLGYNQDVDHFGDASYRLRLTFNHTGGSIKIRFLSSQTSGQNERWGIDNVRLSRVP